jgi:Retrotransposon gag protein
MVITRSQSQPLFPEEAQRLSNIDLDLSSLAELPTRPVIHRPSFSSVMEKQVMNTVAKEQLKNLAKFGGSSEEDVNKWLQDVDEIFDRAQLRPSNRYLVIQSYLTDAAAKWFRHNKATIADWSTFRTEILRAYQPTLNATLFKLEHRHQSCTESVMEYYHDKLQLCSQADSSMSAPMIIHYLIKGLRHALVAHVVRRHPSTPDQFLLIAQDEEKIQLTLNSVSSDLANSSLAYFQGDDSPQDMVTFVNRPLKAQTHLSPWQQQQPMPQPLMQAKPLRYPMSAAHQPDQNQLGVRSYCYPENNSKQKIVIQCY